MGLSFHLVVLSLSLIYQGMGNGNVDCTWLRLCAYGSCYCLMLSLCAAATAVAIFREWIQGLWQWLTPRKEHLPLISTSGWPLLPLEGGLLTPLRPLSSSTVVLRPPDWPQELPPLFRKLGLHLLDTSSFELPEDDLLRQYVHPGDGRGVIAALGVALPPLSRQRSRGGNTSSNLGGDVSFDMSGIEGLTSAEKELLREYLLQGQWLNAAFPATGMSLRCMVQLLRQLPLYQLASSAWTVAHQTHDDDSHLQQQQQEDGADSATASATASAVMLVSLTADSCIAPEGEAAGACWTRVIMCLKLFIFRLPLIRLVCWHRTRNIMYNLGINFVALFIVCHTYHFTLVALEAVMGVCVASAEACQCSLHWELVTYAY